ncbi:MAG: 1-acyl-sn-glycerol-3-phosphate acyltransferase [Bacteroidales bacterium]|nr:1-acyl-sn-glycerol-3-phosphate acyltransferase [Bacteroidales bacterium]
MRVIDVDNLAEMSPFFRGKKGSRRAELFMKLFAIDKVNQIYHNSGHFTGSAFAASLLNDLGINYMIGNAERLSRLPEGAFITVANHPYGGLDGIILIDILAGIRPDYKLMVNKLLSLVKTMKENFISVTPVFTRKKGITGTTIHGIRETIDSLNNGHPVGFFPSGAVSVFSLKNLRVRDRKWQTSILHLIHSMRIPVLPIRFFDANSTFFYFLGLINWKIRTLRMPGEIFNKREKKLRVGIGNLISVKELEKYPDLASLGSFLRESVYKMPLPASFIPRNRLDLNLEKSLVNPNPDLNHLH